MPHSLLKFKKIPPSYSLDYYGFPLGGRVSVDSHVHYGIRYQELFGLAHSCKRSINPFLVPIDINTVYNWNSFGTQVRGLWRGDRSTIQVTS
tara:strand:- start:2750 stop:3025 length:276 start_codon:yes stop_codon:yes gene_type:complete